MSRWLEPADFAAIQGLELRPRRRLAGQVTGEQRSPALGGGIEFADYREYQSGDDVRQMDWSVYRRTRRLQIKLAAEEKEITLLIVLDPSLSMTFGRPPKFVYARKIAALLAGVALKTGNRVGVLSWEDHLKLVVEPVRGERSLPDVVRRLSAMEPCTSSDAVAGVREFAARFSGRSMVVYLTDLLFEPWSTVLAGMGASGCESHVLHVLSPDDWDPSQRGELTLIDAETQQKVPIHLDSSLLERYRAEMGSWMTEVGTRARALGLGYVSLNSGGGLRKTLQFDLVKAGLLC